ncbi:MAG: S41 family peptidase [Bacteroidales bacterium]|nr:S41 family peptidase [Bacteroidales bacterium]
MKKIYIIILLFMVFITSCKKEEEVPYTTDEAARDYLFEAMNELYLWYDQMPDVVKEDYKDPYELMDAMRYETLDRWSFVQTYNEFVAMYKGSFVGHGIRMGLDQENKVRIVQIYKNSQMYLKGVRRGWIIKKINGTDPAPIFIAGEWNTRSESIIGPPEAGITNTFLFQIPDGRDSTITATKSSFTLNTVIHCDTLNLKSDKTGYLVLDQFIPISNQELATAFAFLKQENIVNLIVDLRYNTGGDLGVLTNMASYIAGSAKFSTPFLRFNYNDKNSAENEIYNFKSVASPLNLKKVVVICTRSTASASEDLINGLKPHLDVICIGDTTNGKPVGMLGLAYKTDYMFWPICYSVENSAYQGDFYDGFPPEKYVPDDRTHDWDDRNELCLKEAIYYLEHGSVSPKSIYLYQPSKQFAEKPERFNDAIIINEPLNR